MSSTRRGGDREVFDRYYTPDPLAFDCVRVALSVCPSPSVVLEPSIGGGAFARAVRTLCPSSVIVGVDYDPEAEGRNASDFFHNYDFLSYKTEVPPDLILGNPPYRVAEEHVRHALGTVKPGGVVGMLLRLAFTESKSRVNFWEEYGDFLTSVHVLADRPSFVVGGGRDSCAYGWFLWTKAAGQPSRVIPGWRGGWRA